MWDSPNRAAPPSSAAPDWRATATGLELRWFAVAAVAVPLLLAAGVYWLHRLPPGPNLRGDENLIEVRLIGPQNAGPLNQERPQAAPAERAQAESPADSPARPLPEVASIPDPAPAEQVDPAQAPRTRATAPPVSRIAREQKAATFQRTLLSHIARFREYPDAAKRSQTQGVVRLLFAMRRDGSVGRITIRASSGSAILDGAAMATLRRAQPLPRIPDDLPDNLNILVPVAFDLSY
ncbi:TonB-like protein [Rhodopseudomonas palustris HaA2]|uniref:TonB-like protein n=1 Tax=Rhodopseudomonas palustris (strain HaA2) TaxID=316058 RepID=Q2IXY9_RHOP2|nr:energy transducer TonB [Rhodopseudomonas palustris]ABD06921.1 TonB-like protein [Rhodopseudomonas palustris HaA2]